MLLLLDDMVKIYIWRLGSYGGGGSLATRRQGRRGVRNFEWCHITERECVCWTASSRVQLQGVCWMANQCVWAWLNMHETHTSLTQSHTHSHRQWHNDTDQERELTARVRRDGLSYEMLPGAGAGDGRGSYRMEAYWEGLKGNTSGLASDTPPFTSCPCHHALVPILIALSPSFYSFFPLLFSSIFISAIFSFSFFFSR